MKTELPVYYHGLSDEDKLKALFDLQAYGTTMAEMQKDGTWKHVDLFSEPEVKQ